jgi:hypothetical protein
MSAKNRTRLRLVSGKPAANQVASALKCFPRVIPFEEWKAKRNPTPREEELYHLVVDGLKRISRR